MWSPGTFEFDETLDPSAVPGLTGPRQRPPAWGTLARALEERRPVSAVYHGHERVFCPHVLGWTKLRAKVLAYQVAGTTSTGVLPRAPERCWRSMFVDEVEDAVVTEGRWRSAENYREGRARVGMDFVEIQVVVASTPPGPQEGSRG